MALQGSLSDSGFSDILQFIAHQKKTGILHLKLEEEGAQVCFEEGHVAHAEFVGRETPDAFLAAVDWTPEQFEAVQQQQAETGQSSAEILIEMGLLTADDYTEIANLQIKEIVYELFSWRTGRYHFEPVDLSGFQFAIEPLSVESFIMEGYRRIDEWPKLRTRFPDMQVVYHVIKDPGEGLTGEQLLDAQMDAAFGGFDEEGDEGFGESFGEAASSALTEQDRKVAALCDGIRTIDRLSGLSRLGLFETLSSLGHLLDGGYIEPVPPRELEECWTSQASPLWMRVVAAVAVFMVVGLYFLILPRSKAELSQNAQHVFESHTEHLRANHVVAVEAALEVFRLERGHYPESLDELTAVKLLPKDALTLPDGKTLDYVSVGNDYVLR